MSKQEAINILRSGIERADYPESEIMKEALVALEQAESESGEFTKEFREILRLENEGVEAFVPPSYQMGLDACDLIDRLTRENKAQAERIVKLIQLVRDMNKNIYGLYWKDTLCCHGTWPNYPHIPELLKRIKQALKGGAKE